MSWAASGVAGGASRDAKIRVAVAYQAGGRATRARADGGGTSSQPREGILRPNYRSARAVTGRARIPVRKQMPRPLRDAPIAPKLWPFARSPEQASDSILRPMSGAKRFMSEPEIAFRVCELRLFAPQCPNRIDRRRARCRQQRRNRSNRQHHNRDYAAHEPHAGTVFVRGLRRAIVENLYRDETERQS